MTDHAKLVTYYRELSDDALTEAARDGRGVYRPEAWRVIQDELARRGRSGWPSRVPARRNEPRRRTAGMFIAAFPAVAIAIALFVYLPRGETLLIAPVMGFMTWIGVGAWIDLLTHRATRRKTGRHSTDERSTSR